MPVLPLSSSLRLYTVYEGGIGKKSFEKSNATVNGSSTRKRWRSTPSTTALPTYSNRMSSRWPFMFRCRTVAALIASTHRPLPGAQSFADTHVPSSRQFPFWYRAEKSIKGFCSFQLLRVAVRLVHDIPEPSKLPCAIFVASSMLQVDRS